MHSWYRATTRKSHRRHFASVWTIASFVFLVLLVLIIFFPNDEMMEQLQQYKSADTVTRRYLINLLQTYPYNLQLKLLLARQELALGQLIRVKKILSEVKPHQDKQMSLETQWLEYGMLRYKTFQEKASSAQRKKHEQMMREQIKKLLHQPLDTGDLKILAQDALSLNEPYLAAQYQQRILQQQPRQSLTWYLEAAKTALAAKQYQQSGYYYFMAKKLTPSNKMKKYYFFKAIASLEASGNAVLALQQAEKNIGRLQLAPKVLTNMASLALRAGQPAVAEKYINQALFIHHKATKSDRGNDEIQPH